MSDSLLNPSNLPPEQLKEAQQGAFRAGVKACSPALISVAVWGMVVGVAMIKTNLTILQSVGMALFVSAGSTQLAALPLMAVNAPVWLIFVSCIIVNLRFVIFSVILAPHFSHLTFRQRAFWSYFSGGLPIIYFIQRYSTQQPEAGKFDYLKGIIIPNWITWQIGSLAGIFLARRIPEEWNIGFAGSLAILCILLPMIINNATLVGVMVAGGVALFTQHWPYKAGILAAIIIGMLCAIIWQERCSTQGKP